MYKVVAQSVLLYGSEIWVVPVDIIKVLEGFHHQSERQIIEMTMTRGEGGDWQYPLVVVEMDAAGLHHIGEYIRRRYVTISEKVAYPPIY